MRLPDTAHTSRPWRIHEIAPDFRIEDVWALPTPGGRDDFPLLIERFADGNTSESSSLVVRALFALRWKLGEIFGWDDDEDGVGDRVPSLRDRLPEDLREADRGPEVSGLPFSPLYLLDDEWAAEIANKTMHGVMHVGWVPDGAGGYRGQMAVLVKPNGMRGEAYMAAIKPFRHLLVYPRMLKDIERRWGYESTRDSAATRASRETRSTSPGTSARFTRNA
jgi:uncharacterized protein DUF2867